MGAYERLLHHVLRDGKPREDRTGVGTLSLFGTHMRFNLEEYFPLITTKKVPLDLVSGELLWFLSGSTNAHTLKREYGVSIWDEWANSIGELGPIYGHQWRSWETSPTEPGYLDPIDQISEVIESIKRDPYSRRHIVSAWNVGQIDQMALAPCHVMFQFYVHDGKLSCHLYQRSADMFLGVPFNIASYGLLTRLVALHTGLRAGELIWSGGDTHIYQNHVEQVELQLSRKPRIYPKLHINPGRESIFDHTQEDFVLEGYDPHPHIKGKVAV